MDRWTLLRLLGVAAGAIATARLGGVLTERLAHRLPGPSADSAPSALVRGCRVPLVATTTCGLMLAGEPWVRLAPSPGGAARHVLLLLTIASSAWLTARLATLGIDAGIRLTVRQRDPALVRRARTQAGLLGRLCQALVAVVALGTMLMTYPAVRALGTSLLASAGLAGVVAGVAAQSTLANLFAGIQLAFGDMARIGDVVVVGGEWGTVEEITLTYVVVATWDQRRIIMPVSQFTSRPFENWSRRDPAITGTALLHLDHSAPVAELRREFEALLGKSDLWDGVGKAFQVVDTTPSTIVVRALMTARNGGDAFELRCQVREHLIAFLCEHHPYALPRIGVAAAPGSVPEDVPPPTPSARSGTCPRSNET